jgi:hypothetical protein
MEFLSLVKFHVRLFAGGFCTPRLDAVKSSHKDTTLLKSAADNFKKIIPALSRTSPSPVTRRNWQTICRLS